ncbi:malonate decarboxylase subunit epsilon [Stutzerimonas decontaminans]|uniref:Malonyl CoA-acyl carrier protein transacylase n=2 Tax=Stutzerimonas TaxID=2901164 RepID=A0ABX4VYJ4_9GAMM|nr:malonate decarboxylase subunit epsilon [Stutzerimonas decontaminans]AHY41015.1 malonate decarboxylase subunit epsilon [Stutzerimonas decontaminans]MCQ4247121.1 malonate decarboxylase subunit epsilon [Stutzerimonas decontaminans]PNF85277.1 malonate decarboxylase subunit epsilon [Stutzerimonas decontaminans]
MSSLFAFPGQGAQKPGMLQRLPEAPEVAATLAEASAVLGEDVLLLDSAEALQSTRAVQLCLLIAGVAGARLLMRGEQRPDYVAGLSIGAYAAAVVAESLDYADALRLVALRGELMQQAYPEGYGMTAILGLSLATVERLLAEAAESAYLANINADNQIVIAGSDAAMTAVAAQAKALGASCARRLAMSVPSHCVLLEQPAQQLAEAFAKVQLSAPRIRYLSGSSARPIFDTERLRDDLAFNMCRVVDWQGTLRTAYERGVRLHIEMPPGSVLTGLARRVFEQGTLVAFDGARLDTLDALLRQEGSQSQ